MRAGEAQRHYLMYFNSSEDELVRVFASEHEADEHLDLYGPMGEEATGYWTASTDWLLLEFLRGLIQNELGWAVSRDHYRERMLAVLRDYAAEVGFSGELDAHEALRLSELAVSIQDLSPVRDAFKALEASRDERTLPVTEESWLAGYFEEHCCEYGGEWTSYPARLRERE